MTNTGGAPAGWYHAAGDPDGTHRYWDGVQWIGDPQPIAPPSAASSSPGGGFAAPTPPTPGPTPSGPPPYTAVPGASATGVHADSQSSVGSRTPAEWGTRAIALLIDWGIALGIFLAGLLLAVIGGAIADALGVLLSVLAYVASIGFSIWNLCIRQGATGQSIGKERQGIELVKDETGRPVGGGMAFVRYLLANVLSGVTCGVYGLLDYLWPLWDEDNKRLTDKIVTMSVVVV